MFVFFVLEKLAVLSGKNNGHGHSHAKPSPPKRPVTRSSAKSASTQESANDDDGTDAVTQVIPPLFSLFSL